MERPRSRGGLLFFGELDNGEPGEWDQFRDWIRNIGEGLKQYIRRE